MKVREQARVELDRLQEEYNEKCRLILIKEAKEQSYKVGQIIEDHHQIGEITKVFYSTSVNNRVISVSYICNKLTKKLKPYKSRKLITVWHENIERLIKHNQQ